MLKFYGKTHHCQILMTQLRRGSRKLWNDNLKEWSINLSGRPAAHFIANKLEIDFPTSTAKLDNFIALKRYVSFKVCINLDSKSDVDGLYKDIKKFENPSLMEVSKASTDLTFRSTSPMQYLLVRKQSSKISARNLAMKNGLKSTRISPLLNLHTLSFPRCLKSLIQDVLK